MKQEILRLRQSGLTYTEIKRELGCSLSTISYHLSSEQREKVASRSRDRKNSILKYLQELKESAPCADCGENYPYFMKDFDHRPDEEKLFNLSEFRSVTKSMEKIEREAQKCDIVCANCHRLRSWQRQIKD
jgi:predicted transcriptional regulator